VSKLGRLAMTFAVRASVMRAIKETWGLGFRYIGIASGHVTELFASSVSALAGSC